MATVKGKDYNDDDGSGYFVNAGLRSTHFALQQTAKPMWKVAGDITDISGSQMFDPMWEAMPRLERLGFCVLV